VASARSIDLMRAALFGIWLLPALLLVGCDKKASKCEQAVRHVTFALIPADAESQPGEGERRIMEIATRMAMVKCESEGLSDAQAACILGVKTLDELLALGECPAIREKKPSWLILPAVPPGS
jgi:hypothetical protein